MKQCSMNLSQEYENIFAILKLFFIPMMRLHHYVAY